MFTCSAPPPARSRCWCCGPPATMEADPPPPASALMEELVEEVLLRFPPADPASLVRAALVCKRWRRIVTGPRFRRRYRDLHLHRGSPPMLGFLASVGEGTRFVSTSTFRPAPPVRGWRVFDARHGRALLRRGTSFDPPVHCEFAVWDPATGRRTELPCLPWSPYYSWNAAVLCAAATTASASACNHVDCHFLVVVVGFNRAEMFAHVYSSEAGEWSGPTPALARHPDGQFDLAPSALAGNALYFAFHTATEALEFDLGTREMAVVRLPAPPRSRDFSWEYTVLATRDDGRLGLATADKSTIYLWAREADGDWVQTRAVELDTLLPAGAISEFGDVVSFADGVGVVFVKAAGALFTIDLKSRQVTKVSSDTSFFKIYPYISFHTPALEVASSSERPSSGAQGAERLRQQQQQQQHHHHHQQQHRGLRDRLNQRCLIMRTRLCSILR